MNLLPKHVFGIRIVQPFVELEICILPRLVNGPAGKASRHFRDVFLRVTAVHPERVEFHQLAAVIFVQPAHVLFLLLCLRRGNARRPRAPEPSAAPLLAKGAFGGLALRGSRVRAQEIVQIEKHRRALCRLRDQVLELPQGVRLDDVTFVRSEVVAVFSLAGKNVEVVKPKVVHDLLELPLAVDRAANLGHGELGHNALRPLAIVGNGTRHVVGVASAEHVALPCPVRCNIPRRRLLLHRRRRVAHLLFCLRIIPRLLWRTCFGSGSGLPLSRLHVPRSGVSCRLGAALFRLLALEFFFRQACLLRGLLGLRIFINQFRCRHLQRRIVLKTRLHRLVINRVGIELLVDPFGQTHLPDALHVARSWPVGQSVQGMKNGFVRGELGDR